MIMSIDMYLNKSKNQASNMRKLSQAMNQSYDSLNNAVLQFVTKEDLIFQCSRYTAKL